MLSWVRNIIGPLTLALWGSACNPSKPHPAPEPSPSPTVQTAPLPAPPQRPPSVEEQITSLTGRWNDGHTAARAKEIGNIFGDQVFFYGVKLPRAEVVQRKLELFEKNRDFAQKIVSRVRVVEKEGHAFASFVKEVHSSGKTTKYPSYLEFVKEHDQWVIVTESDETTDRNLTKYTGSSVGDYDGDGVKETAKLESPILDDEDMDCAGPCDCTIVFSDPKLPKITIDDCIGGVPLNEGDLDGDGADELGLLPWWFTSCWRGYQVHTIKEGKAKLFTSILTHCSQWEDGQHPIEKDPDHPGHLIIRESRMVNSLVETRSVPVGDLARD